MSKYVPCDSNEYSLYTNNAHGKEEIKENVGHVYPLHTNIIQEDLPKNSTVLSLDVIAGTPYRYSNTHVTNLI